MTHPITGRRRTVKTRPYYNTARPPTQLI